MNLKTLNKNILVNEVEINFLFDEVNEEIYFKATKIAKVFNKKVIEFFRLPTTKDYISILNSVPFIAKQGKYNGETWIHYKLLKPFLR